MLISENTLKMSKQRSIKRIIKAMKVNMGGIILDQALPVQEVDKIDPILLVHHLKDRFPAGSKQQDVGVPPHPHRGFAPVTFVFKGGVHHRDSMDISSVIYEGGTQWMHAGNGIVHSERPAKEIAAKGGEWEIIQWWVNVPAKYKMTEQSYKPLTYDETPVVLSDDKLVEVGVVSGSLNGVQGKIDTYSPILSLRMVFQNGGKIKIPIPKSYNAFIYLLDGQLTVNGDQEAKGKDLVWLENDGDFINLEACEDTRAIILSGEPINEPVATYGPFVMNNQSEILQAMRDYQKGAMGVLEEKFD